MRTLLALIVALPMLSVALPVAGYLLVLTLAAPFGKRRPRRSEGSDVRFAVLVPAHDEERVIGRLLASLQAVRYPAGLLRVNVVADNCQDGTAAVAAAAGARVYERHDPLLRGKGHALAWLLDQLAREDEPCDAYVVLDADTVVEPGFFDALARRIAAGEQVLQGYYTVLTEAGSRGAALREAALTLVHYLRPLAKVTLGLSCGLKGNGMCFHRSVIERFGWPTAGLAEDVEFHLMLVAAGLRVRFVPDAVLRAEMPASLGGARTQNTRWEAGRLAAIRRYALPLLRRGILRRDAVALDAALEQLTPPLSVPVASTVLALIGGLALGVPLVWGLSLALLGFFALHLLAGLLLAGAPAHVYRALLHLPVYIAWKSLLYLRAMTGRQPSRWVRTEHGGPL